MLESQEGVFACLSVFFDSYMLLLFFIFQTKIPSFFYLSNMILHMSMANTRAHPLGHLQGNELHVSHVQLHSAVHDKVAFFFFGENAVIAKDMMFTKGCDPGSLRLQHSNGKKI